MVLLHSRPDPRPVPDGYFVVAPLLACPCPGCQPTWFWPKNDMAATAFPSLRMGRKAILIYAYARKRAYGNLFPVFDLYFTENLKPTTTTRDDSGIFMYGIGKVKLLRNAHISRLLPPLERYWTLCLKWSWNSTGTAYHTSHENKALKK